MASFDPDVELSHAADYRLMMNSFVTLFWRPEVLRKSIDQLSALGYDVVEVDASSWTAEEVQSDDPHIVFAPVGATPVVWNDAEWHNSSRHGN